MLAAVLAGLCLPVISQPEAREVLPGRWVPWQVGVAQRLEDPEGEWEKRELLVTLKWRPDDWRQLAALPEEERDALSRTVWRLFKDAMEVFVMAGDEKLYVQQGRDAGQWMWSGYFPLPTKPVDSLELYVRTFPYSFEPFTCELSPDSQAATTGPLSWRFDRLDPSRTPVEAGREVGALFPNHIRNDFWVRPSPEVEPASRLAFVGPERIDFDIASCVEPDQIVLQVGGKEITPAWATIVQSHDLEAKPWFFFWVPVPPEELTGGWRLVLRGDYLAVGREVADERMYELPTACLVP